MFFRSLLLCGLAIATANGQAVNLGTAAAFAVLGSSTVTNTGPSILNGDLGVSAGSSAPGFPPGVVNGVKHFSDAVAITANNDATTAYNNAAGRAYAPGNDLTGQNLGSKTLAPAVYHFSSSAFLTDTLTLDGGGDPNAVFIFQIGSTLITSPASSVVLTNGAKACNVFWQVGSAATLDTTTTFFGNIVAYAAISLNTGASNLLCKAMLSPRRRPAQVQARPFQARLLRARLPPPLPLQLRAREPRLL
ncbi:MAG: hypothetical protein M4579_006207 [Chaenotheca gracillima]|nr:MAG: hypothetical protein M4579_006207 [Chaenotheca gracillima]